MEKDPNMRDTATEICEDDLEKVGGGASMPVFRCQKCGKMYGSETVMKDGKRVCGFCGLPVVQTTEKMSFR